MLFAYNNIAERTDDIFSPLFYSPLAKEYLLKKAGTLFALGTNMTEFETEKFVLSFKDIRDFYKTGKWKTFRKKEMKKKKHRCELCWNGGFEHKEVRRYRRATVLHHIKHLRQFPALGLTSSNTMALCEECHRKMHPEEYKQAKIAERWD